LQDGQYRAAMYLRPLAIWAIEHALRQKTANAAAVERLELAEA
jgi:hypothetical protein